MPDDATCAGRDISPPLQWTPAPQGTVSQVLICEDPDASGGTWAHWVMFNLPSSLQQLSAGVPPKPVFPNGVRQGLNDFNTIGYKGPCPPPGKGVHRYRFRLFAINTTLGLSSRATRADVLQAISGRIVGEAELTGRYGR
jgi:Raf kinase inhibitor-like YbhB/YbcL family protein